MHCHAVVTHLPQGPSLRLANGNLVGPMRPTRGHSATSPHGGLYALPSPCRSAWATRERFRSFADHSVLACHPLRPRGVRTSISSSAAMSTLAFAELPAARHSQNSRNPFRAGCHFEASTVHPFATACQFACPLHGSDRISPAIGDFYFWASSGSVALPAARYDYNSDWTPCMGPILSRGCPTGAYRCTRFRVKACRTARWDTSRTDRP
jgi:hypothetical protein